MSKKRKNTPVETGIVAEYVLIWLVKAYVFLMLVVFPLYYRDKYYDMCDAKWLFFRNVSAFFGVAAVVVFLWYAACFLAEKKLKVFLRNAYHNINVTDRFVFAYLIVCCVSTLITPCRRFVIWGYSGWYMGLIAQVSFVLLYFLVSRFWRWDATHLLLFFLAAFVVFFQGVIMRFRIDPLKMYVDLDEYYIQHFLSTLGQVTWYSGYLCMICPLGLVAYWCAQKLWQRIVSGIFIGMSFMSVVTQNSDSAYMAIAGTFFMLFWISFASDEKFLRFLECCIIALASFKGMGLLQILYAERMVGLDPLSVFMSQSAVTLVLLVVVILLYLFLRYVAVQRAGFQIASWKRLRAVALVLVILGGIGVVLYISLNTAGVLPEQFLSKSGYLVFDDHWGNNRGVSWRCSAEAFLKGDVVRKLFGAGPDSFAEYLYTGYREDFERILGKETIQACAHNEWLNTLINLGILGLVTYFGIFLSAFRDCMKGADKYPYLYGAAIAIVAYIVHNVFCYQQIIGTPTIFILMGMAQSVKRYGDGDEL